VHKSAKGQGLGARGTGFKRRHKLFWTRGAIYSKMLENQPQTISSTNKLDEGIKQVIETSQRTIL